MSLFLPENDGRSIFLNYSSSQKGEEDGIHHRIANVEGGQMQMGGFSCYCSSGGLARADGRSNTTHVCWTQSPPTSRAKVDGEKLPLVHNFGAGWRESFVVNFQLLPPS